MPEFIYSICNKANDYGFHRARLDYVKKVEVLNIRLTVGEGTDKDPVRFVDIFCDLDGGFIAEIDYGKEDKTNA